MKIGKVFDKLAARKTVAQITFGENACTVHLTNGNSLLCKSAHEARLFIDSNGTVGPVGSLIEEPAPFATPAVIEALAHVTQANAAPTPRDATIARLADEAFALQNVTVADAGATPVAACGTEAPERFITLDADYVRIRGGGLIEVPYNATSVRVTAQAAAALIAGGFEY